MATYDVLELQPSNIELRLIQPAAAGGISRLGRNWLASWEGINGRGGFVKGTYGQALNQEGKFSLTFPNAAGDDGVLHRKRFLILTDPSYQPGDEWIEIWGQVPGSRAGELLFTGSPTDYSKTPDTIEISGYDAFWMQKKSRETNAGAWVSGPWDMFSHYAGRWLLADYEDFPTDGPSYNFGTSESTSADGRIAGRRARTDPAFPGRLRISSTATNGSARGYVRFTKPLSVGVAQVFRFEARLEFERVGGGSQAAIIQVGPADTVGAQLYMSLLNPSGSSNLTLSIGNMGGPPAKYMKGIQAQQSVHVAIECRSKWAFFYVEGVLVRVALLSSTFVGTQYAGIAYDGIGAIAVDFMMLRDHESHLLQIDSGVRKLPVAPSDDSGLWAEFFDNKDLRSDATGASPAVAWARNLMLPTQEPYATRVDPVINFGHGGAAPAGWYPGQTELVSARWSGSAYFDLDNYDYSVRFTFDDLCRAWIGSTQLPYANDWWEQPTGAGLSVTLSSLRNHLSGTYLDPLDVPSGWYPIIIEWAMGTLVQTASPHLLIEYNRSDQPNLWVPLGATEWPHKARALGQTHMWSLAGSAMNFDHSPGGAGNANPTTPTAGVLPVTPQGPAVRSKSWDFAASTHVSTSTSFVTTTPGKWSAEAWCMPDTLDAVNVHNVLRKSSTFIMRFGLAGEVQFYHYNNAGVATLHSYTPPVSLIGQLVHLFLVFDNGVKRGYVNGVEVVNVSGQTFTAVDPGAVVTVGNVVGGAEWFDGRVGPVAIYENAAPTAAQVEELYESGLPNADAHVKLSPYGIVRENVRGDSHYDMLVSIMEQFGFQALLEPRPLEDTIFPGVLIPQARVGRDTDLAIGEDNEVIRSTVSVRGSATDRADGLVLDAAGIADQQGSGQLTVERFNIPELGKHTFLSMEAESISDITQQPLALARAESLLALRGSVWEEAGLQPRGQRRLVDTFPMTGALAEIKWLPGDGVRLNLPSVDLVDQTPRQIMVVDRAFVPNGFQGMQVSFRQRPRGLRRTLERLRRATYSQIRNYQGQFVVISGSLGSTNQAGVTQVAASDAYSRVSLPADLERIVRLELVIMAMDAGVAGTVELMGSSLARIVSGPGVMDLTKFLAISVGVPYAYARLISITGTGVYVIQLRAIARV